MRKKILLWRKLHKRLFLITGFVILSFFSFAQEKISVEGRVFSQSDMPLSGTSVIVEGGKAGTVTDVNGNFFLKVNKDDLIVFSAVGYRVEKIKITKNETSLIVRMTSSSSDLEEVVVIGYGQRTKKHLTEAVTTIQADQLTDLSKGGFDQMLQGKVPGVQVQQNSGAPGGNVNIMVRGIHSITGNNQPLYVIDGFPVSTEGTASDNGFSDNLYSTAGISRVSNATVSNPLNMIDPADIKSISILKDAQATSIYGSRGSNGVVIIETKRGVYGKGRISINTSYGLQEVAHQQELLNAKQYAEYVTEARDNAWVFSGGKINDPNSVRSVATQVRPEFRNPEQIDVNTNWQDVIFRTAPITKNNLSVSGGSGGINYYLAGGYFLQEGIIKRSNYDRYNLRTNLSFKVSDKLQIGTSTFFTVENNRTPNVTGHYGKAGIISAVNAASPTIPVYDSDGNPFFSQADVTDGLGWLVNPLVMLAGNDIKSKSTSFLSNNFVEYKIVNNLKLRSSLGINFHTKNNNVWKSSRIPDNTTLVTPPLASAAKSSTIEWLNENILSYDNTLNDHKFGGVIGFTTQKNTFDNLYAAAANFTSDNIPYISGGIVNEGNQSISEWSLMSFLSRIDYSYKDKYLFTASFRRDGSSRFGSESKWGTFPSIALGYILSNEDFLKDNRVISNLKLSMNYGIVGNNNIGNYAHLGLISNNAPYVQNGALVPGSYIGNLPNDELQWEKTDEFNFGINLGLFSDRISLDANIYNSLTKNLLLNVELPTISGFSNTIKNIGKVENKGFEIGINSLNIDTKNIKWKTNLTFSVNKNKVKELASESGQIVNSSVQVTRVGYPISSFYLIKMLGVFRDKDEISGSPLFSPQTELGDPRFENYDGNKVINQQDRQIVGNPWPDFTWGLNNSLIYKNFSFNFNLVGSHGADIYDLSSQLTLAGVQNLYSIYADRWSPENPNGKYPRAIRNNYANTFATNSTFRLFDGSFVRVSNVGLGYKIPTNLISKLHILNAEVDFQVSNLHTFTNYPGYDPEVNTAGGDITQTGTIYNAYPLSRSFIFGIKCSF